MTVETIKFSSQLTKMKFPVIPSDGIGETEMAAVPWNDGTVEILMMTTDRNGKAGLKALTTRPMLARDDADDTKGKVSEIEKLVRNGPKLPLHFVNVPLPAPLFVSNPAMPAENPYKAGAMAPQARFSVDVRFSAPNAQAGKARKQENAEVVAAITDKAVAHVLVDGSTGLSPTISAPQSSDVEIGHRIVPNPMIAELTKERDGSWVFSPDGLIALPDVVTNSATENHILSLRTQIIGQNKYILLFVRTTSTSPEYLEAVKSNLWFLELPLNGKRPAKPQWQNPVTEVFHMNAWFGPLPAAAPVNRLIDGGICSAEDWRKEVEANIDNIFLHATEWEGDRWTFVCRNISAGVKGQIFRKIANQGGKTNFSPNSKGDYNQMIGQKYSSGEPPNWTTYKSFVDYDHMRNGTFDHYSFGRLYDKNQLGVDWRNFPILELSRNPKDAGQYRLAYSVVEQFGVLTTAGSGEDLRTVLAAESKLIEEPLPKIPMQPEIPTAEALSKAPGASADDGAQAYDRQPFEAYLAKNTRLDMTRKENTLPVPKKPEDDVDRQWRICDDIRRRIETSETSKKKGFSWGTGNVSDAINGSRAFYQGCTTSSLSRLVADVCGRSLDAACTYRPFGLVAYPCDEIFSQLSEVGARNRFAWGEEPYFNGRLVKFTSSGDIFCPRVLEGNGSARRKESKDDSYIWIIQNQITGSYNILDTSRPDFRSSRRDPLDFSPTVGDDKAPSQRDLFSLSTRWGKAYYTQPDVDDKAARCDIDQTGPDFTPYPWSAMGQSEDFSVAYNAHNFVVCRGQALDHHGQPTDELTDHLFYFDDKGQLSRRIRLDHPMGSDGPRWTEAEAVLDLAQIYEGDGDDKITLPMDHEESFAYVVQMTLLKEDGKTAVADAEIKLKTNALSLRPFLTNDGLKTMGGTACASLVSDEDGKVIFAFKSKPMAAPTFSAEYLVQDTGQRNKFVLPMNQGIYGCMASWDEGVIRSLVSADMEPDAVKAIHQVVTDIAKAGMAQGESAGLTYDNDFKKPLRAQAETGLLAGEKPCLIFSGLRGLDSEVSVSLPTKTADVSAKQTTPQFEGTFEPVEMFSFRKSFSSITHPFHKLEDGAKHLVNKIEEEASDVGDAIDAAVTDLKQMKDAGKGLVTIMIDGTKLAAEGTLAYALSLGEKAIHKIEDADHRAKGCYAGFGDMISGVMNAAGTDINSVWDKVIETTEAVEHDVQDSLNWLIGTGRGIGMGLRDEMEGWVKDAVKEVLGDLSKMEKFGKNAAQFADTVGTDAVEATETVVKSSLSTLQSFSKDADKWIAHVENMLQENGSKALHEAGGLLESSGKLIKKDFGWVKDHIEHLDIISSASKGVTGFLGAGPSGDNTSAGLEGLDDLFTTVKEIAEDLSLDFATGEIDKLHAVALPIVTGFDELLDRFKIKDKLPMGLIGHVEDHLKKLAAHWKDETVKEALDWANPLVDDVKSKLPDNAKPVIEAGVLASVSVLSTLINGIIDLITGAIDDLAEAFPLTVDIEAGASGNANVVVEVGGSAVVEVEAGAQAGGSANLDLSSTLVGVTAAISAIAKLALNFAKFIVDFVVSLFQAASSQYDAASPAA